MDGWKWSIPTPVLPSLHLLVGSWCSAMGKSSPFYCQSLLTATFPTSVLVNLLNSPNADFYLQAPSLLLLSTWMHECLFPSSGWLLIILNYFGAHIFPGLAEGILWFLKVGSQLKNFIRFTKGVLCLSPSLACIMEITTISEIVGSFSTDGINLAP